MKVVKKMIDMGLNLYKRNSFVRFLVVLLCFSILYCIMDYNYGGNFITYDDTESERVLSGYYTGKPSSYALFVSTPLGVFLKFLYLHIPNVRWYTYFLVFSTVLSVSVITHVMIEQILFKNKRKQIMKLISILFVSIALFVYPFYYISFTITSALYAAASIVLFLSISDQKQKFSFYLKYIVCILFLLMSQLVRAATFKAVIPFFILAFIFVIDDNRKKWNKAVSLTLIISTVVSLSAFFLIDKWDAYYKDNVVESESYVELKKYRSYYSDYLTLDYSSHRELFDSLGWDESFYILSRNWMHLDKRFNAENLKIIVETQKNEISRTNIIDKIGRFVSNLKTVESLDYPAILKIKRFLPFGISSIALLGIFFLRKHKRKKNSLSHELLFFSMSNIIAAMECFYLCLLGRFFLRAILCAIIPALCIDVFILIRNMPIILKKFSHHFLKINQPIELDFIGKSTKKVLPKELLIRCDNLTMIIILIISFFTMTKMLCVTFDTKEIAIRNNYSMRSRVVENFCAAHPENFYVHDHVAVMDKSVRLKPDNLRGRRMNLLFYGGTQAYSKNYYDAIHAFGYDEFYMDNLLDENVYFVTSNSSLENSDMLNYMRNAYGDDIQCYLVDKICDGVFVYKFLRPEKNYELFSQKLLKTNVCLISENENLNNSEFAAYVRAEYGNDINCKLLAKLSENTFLYIIVKENEESENISIDILDFLHEKDIFYINE